MCVAFAVTGFIASADGASAARMSQGHGLGSHRQAGRSLALRRARAPARHRAAGRRQARHDRSFAQARHTRFHLHAGATRRHDARSRLHIHAGRVRAARYPGGSNARGAVAPGEQTGRASFYRGGGRTAAGGRVGVATCAHRTLPFGTKVLVTNLGSGRQAVLTVNDRGPFVRGRIVDVSAGAAGRLGMIGSGTAQVRLQVLAARREE